MKKILLYLILSSFCGFSQKNCPKSLEFYDLLIKIKDSTKLVTPAKIKAYLLLEKNHLPCTTIHDTVWAKLYNLKAYYYYTLDNTDFQKPITETQKAYQYAIKHKNIKPQILAKAADNLGLYYYMTLNFEKSNEYYYKEIEFSRDSLKIAECYKNIATQTYLFGDFEKTILVARKGLPFAKNGKNYLADLHNIISNAYKDLENIDLAYHHIKLANNYFNDWEKETKQSDFFSHGLYVLNLGNLLKSLKKYGESKKCYLEATKLFEKAERFDRVIQNGLVNQGDLYEVTKNNKAAKEIYARAEKLILEKTPNDKDGAYARVNGNLAKILTSENQFEAAISNFKKAFSFFPKFDVNAKNFTSKTFASLKDKAILQDILTDYANCMKAYFVRTKNTKYLNESRRIFNMADNVIDAMRQEHTGTQSKYFWRKQTRSIYENAIETCYLLKDYEKAFYFFEKSRAVLLNDKLNELSAKQSLSETDRQEERKFLQKLNELNSNLEKAKTQVEKDKINSELIDLQERQENFIKTLETKNPAYYQLKYSTTTTTLKQFQNYLTTPSPAERGQGATVATGEVFAVEYFHGDSATYAIIISPNSVSLKKLDFKASLSRNFLNLCSKNLTTKTEFNDFLSASSALYQSLIEPLNLPKGRLIISQDGEFLPYEALSKSATNPDFLLYDFAISYTYSAQSLLKNHAKYGFLPNKTFLGIAPVNYSSPNLNSLNGSDVSIDKIASLFWFSDRLNQQKATKNAFLQEAQKHQIVQLYTHAFADTLETEPRIYFADSSLKVSELGNGNQFKTNLLVLTACKTGIGKVAKGEGVLSLARGFSMVGIPSTITTLWSVEDQPTYQLTEYFYEFLSKGLSKDEALQQAKIKFLGPNPQISPSKWAGIILIGDTSAIEKSPILWWVLGGFLFLGLLFLVYRKMFFKKQH